MSCKKLADFCEIVMGQSPPGELCNQSGIGLPLLNGPTEFGIRHPHPKQYTVRSTRIAQVDDILFCVRGSTTGRMNWADQEYVIGRGVAAIRHRNGSQFQPFVKALLELELSNLLLKATGSTFPNVSRKDLEDLAVGIEDKKEQERISEFIGALEKKIYLNHTTNETLEEMARAIFKSWFVDFDPVRAKMDGRQPFGMDAETAALFPDELVHVNGELIPKGWEFQRVGEFLSIKHGFAFKGEFFSKEPTNSILLTPGNFRIGGGFKDDKLKFYDGPIPADYVMQGGELLLTMTDLSKAGDTLGYPAFVPDFPKRYQYLHNQRVGRVDFQVENDCHIFFYHLFCLQEYRHYVLATASGSTVKHSSPKYIESFKFAAPPLDLMEHFTKLSAPFFEMQSKNGLESLSLTEIRDTLLPRLLSGEITIGEAEKIVEKVA